MAGTGDKIKGKTKQAAGDVTDDEQLKQEGKLDEAGGKVKDVVGDAKDAAESVVDGVTDKLKR